MFLTGFPEHFFFSAYLKYLKAFKVKNFESFLRKILESHIELEPFLFFFLTEEQHQVV